MKRKSLVLGLLIPVLLVAVLSFSSGSRYFDIVRNLEIFASVYTEANKYYVDPLNPNHLLQISVDAMLKTLDPYTIYVSEDDIEDYQTNTTSEYAGVGVESDTLRGKHVILNIYEGMPAEGAGLKIGDQLVNVNGIPLLDLSQEEVGKLVKGQADTDVKIDVLRNGKELSFTVKRQKITLPTVSYSALLTNQVGYLRLREFAGGAAKDVQRGLQSLKEKGASRLILDLRGNPGGLLSEAVDVCNVFLPKGIRIVDTKGKIKAKNQFHFTEKDPLDIRIPLAVLIDENSASASEIVSGVMQDYDRGVVIGQTSYGKGLVQVGRTLPFNAYLKVTISKYYIPSGRCIQTRSHHHDKPKTEQAKAKKDAQDTAFYTANGRAVYEGGGITPDVYVETSEYSSYTKNLIQSGWIFDYATGYYYKHDSLPAPTVFHLTNEAYQAFCHWMKSKSFDSFSNVEYALTLLKETVSKDSVYTQLTDEIAMVQHAVGAIKSHGLASFREEIISALEQAIILRYYHFSGQMKASLAHDHEVKQAIDILSDPYEYAAILKVE